MIVAGFPCKGTSRCMGANNPKLSNPSSSLFDQIPRAKLLLKAAAMDPMRNYPDELCINFSAESVVVEREPQRAWVRMARGRTLVVGFLSVLKSGQPLRLRGPWFAVDNPVAVGLIRMPT